MNDHDQRAKVSKVFTVVIPVLTMILASSLIAVPAAADDYDWGAAFAISGGASFQVDSYGMTIVSGSRDGRCAIARFGLVTRHNPTIASAKGDCATFTCLAGQDPVAGVYHGIAFVTCDRPEREIDPPASSKCRAEVYRFGNGWRARAW
jgi:hypothetical protein